MILKVYLESQDALPVTYETTVLALKKSLLKKESVELDTNLIFMK